MGQIDPLSISSHCSHWQLANVKLTFLVLENGRGETMRGCFNSVIAGLVVEGSEDKVEEGCHPIPRRFGSGTLCLCDSYLCNSASSLGGGSTRFQFSMSSIVKSCITNKLYFALFIVAVLVDQIPLLYIK